MVLSHAEQDALRRYEVEVDKFAKCYQTAAAALYEIYESGFYKSVAPTFTEYCRKRWPKVDAGYCKKLVTHHQTLLTIAETSPGKPLPQNEFHTRPMAKLLSKSGKEVSDCWAQILEENPDGITHKAVVAGVQKYLGEPVKPAPAAQSDEPAKQQQLEAFEQLETMEQWNTRLESFCQGVVDYATKNCPEGAWLDQRRKDIALRAVQQAVGSYRLATGKAPCPLCNNRGCEKCRFTCFMPRAELAIYL